MNHSNFRKARFVLSTSLLAIALVAAVTAGPAAAQNANEPSEEPAEQNETDVLALDEGHGATLTSPEQRARLAELIDDPGSEVEITKLSESGDLIIPLEVEGFDPTLRLVGSEVDTTLTLQVPEGYTPRFARTKLTLSPSVSGGYIGYQTTGGTAKSLHLDRDDLGQNIDGSTVVFLDLRGTTVQDGSFELSLMTQLTTTVDECSATGGGAWIDLADSAMLVEGSPTKPTVVSEFIPELLTDLTILIPQRPTPNEAEAATKAALGAVRKVAGTTPNVSVIALEAANQTPQLSFDPTHRVIAVSEAFPAGLRIESTDAPILTIGGPPAEIVRSAEAFGTEHAALAAGANVRVENPSAFASVTAPQTVADQTDPPILALRDDDEDQTSEGRPNLFTLDQLDVHSLGVSGVGRMEMLWFVNQAQLGGPIEAAELQVQGRFSPIREGAEGGMSVFVNGVLQHSADLSTFDDGSFSYQISVDPELLTRTLSIQTLVDYSPANGICTTGSLPFELQVDPTSRLTVTPGQLESANFERYPQALLPEFFVGLDEYNPERTSLAVKTLVSLQRASSVLLKPIFTTFEQAAVAESPSLLVAHDDGKPGEFLSFLKQTSEKQGGPAQGDDVLEFDVDQSTATLSTYVSNSYDRLVLSWTEGENGSSGMDLARQLVQSISTRSTPFASLYGDTYLMSDGSPPLSISLRSGTVQPSLLRLSPNYLGRAIPLLLAAAFIVFVIFVVARLRRRTLRIPVDIY